MQRAWYGEDRAFQEDFRDPDLSFLKKWQIRELVSLAAEGIAFSVSSRDSYDSDSAYSEGSTVSADTSVDGGSDTEQEKTSIAAYNSRDPEDFQDHMQKFMHDFAWYMENDLVSSEFETYEVSIGSAGNSNWTWCMLLWVDFARSALSDDDKRSKWLDACKNEPSQERLLALLTSCLISVPTLRLWRRDVFEDKQCNKQHAAGIYFTSLLVEEHLKGDGDMLTKWTNQVERSDRGCGV